MIILAIDPGTVASAYVLWDTKKTEILDKCIIENSLILTFIHSINFDLLAIEMIASYGMPVGKEVFETCLWIGRFIQVADSRGVQFIKLLRKDVKSFLCGSMKAKDSNIRQALIDLLGKDKTKGVSKDMWSALAIAVLGEKTWTE